MKWQKAEPWTSWYRKFHTPGRKRTNGNKTMLNYLIIRNPISHIRTHGAVCRVCRKNQKEQQTERDAPFFRNFIIYFSVKRQKYTYQRCSPQAEDYRPQQADSSVYIQEMTAVVPPSDSPLKLQEITGQVFQNGTDGQRQPEGPEGLFLEGAEEKAQQKPANAVDGKVGSLIDAPVYKGMLRKKEQYHFPEPADKGKDKKQQGIIIKFAWYHFSLHRC